MSGRCFPARFHLRWGRGNRSTFHIRSRKFKMNSSNIFVRTVDFRFQGEYISMKLSIRVMLVCRSVIINDVGTDKIRFRAYQRLAAQRAQHRRCTTALHCTAYCPTNCFFIPEHKKPAGYMDERREGARTYSWWILEDGG